MTERVDCLVIGAGVIGLAVARELALAGREVIVVEAESSIGEHTSSRNSEVVHAGIYYPKTSLKARFCVEGKHRLCAYARERGIPHSNCGKIIVASRPEENAAVLNYIKSAADNGVSDLRPMDLAEVRELEPAILATAAVYSPSSGIVDSHALMLSLQGDAEQHGAMVAFQSKVTRGAVAKDGIYLDVEGADSLQVVCNSVINCAGLYAPDVARSIEGIPAHTIPPQYFAKAHYFTLSGRPPFKRLIYPVGHSSWLGVHVTIDMAGQARFGPDIEWTDRVDYEFDVSRESQFRDAIRRYYPGVDDRELQPGYTGIRPKISGKGEPAADFRIHGEADHGVKGLVNLYGIESPGLTSCMAIGAYVRAMLEQMSGNR